jgi:hypothetical protein
MDQAMAVRAKESNVREPGRTSWLKLAHGREVVALDDSLDIPFRVGIEAASFARKRTSSAQHLPTLPIDQALTTLAPSVGDNLNRRLVDLVVVLG